MAGASGDAEDRAVVAAPAVAGVPVAGVAAEAPAGRAVAAEGGAAAVAWASADEAPLIRSPPPRPLETTRRAGGSPG